MSLQVNKENMAKRAKMQSFLETMRELRCREIESLRRKNAELHKKVEEGHREFRNQ